MIRGGSDPLLPMASMPKERMGLPPRSLAADAHDCIMVRSSGIYRIQGRGVRSLRPTLGRLASDRLFARCWGNAAGRLIPTSPSLAAVLGPVKEWPGNDLRGEMI
jgi:hypothetical protein